LPLDDPIRNSGLFADHFLQHKLPGLGEWQALEGLEGAFAEVKAIYTAAAEFGDNTNEAQTENDLIRPLLDILWGHDCYQVQTGLPNLDAYGRPDYAFFVTPTERTAAQKHVNTREYWRDVACLGDAKRWSGSLDHEAGGRSPSSQIAGYLYHGAVRWGILTNGRVWRLYEQDRSRAGGTFYEVNLEALVRRNDREGFRRFLLFFRREAFVPGVDGKTFLEKVFDGSVEYATEVGDRLKDSVYDALRSLMNGFFEWPGNGLDPRDPDTLGLVHDNALIVLYRLLFMLFAEDRGLLPCDDDRYEGYSLRKLHREVNARLRAGPAYHSGMNDLWTSFCSKCRVVDRGLPEGGGTIVPAYNGGLFSAERHAHIAHTPQAGEARWEVGDARFAEVIDLLAYERRQWNQPGREDRDIDYGSLAVQHLGSIYEGLLELQPQVADEEKIETTDKGKPIYRPAAEVPQPKPVKGQPPRRVAPGEVYLVTDRGERKATGSYYTPSYIVDYIVEHTVGPLADEAAKQTAEMAKRAKELEGRLKRANGKAKTGERAEWDELQRRRLEPYLSLKILDPAMGSGHFLVGAADFLSLAMATDPSLDGVGVGSPTYEQQLRGQTTKPATARVSSSVPSGEEAQAYYKRLVVERCLYGVDLNPLAVELAKLSLWLHTVSRDKALSFLDHHLRCGNSLIGARIEEDLSREPPRFTAKGKRVKEDGAQLVLGFTEALIQKRMEPMLAWLRAIMEGPSGTAKAEHDKETLYEGIERAREPFREVANCWLAPYFGVPVTPEQYGQAVEALKEPEKWEALEGEEWFQAAQKVAQDRRFFHWELEFPECFFGPTGLKAKEERGFEAVIGNPPYVTTGGLRAHALAEWGFYRTAYRSASHGKFDVYMPFLERGAALGRVCGVILPNKWMQSDAGALLRADLALAGALDRVVDFGAQQVFQTAQGGGPTTYTCLAFTRRERVPTVEFWRATAETGCPCKQQVRVGSTQLSAAPWAPFADDAAFARAPTEPLGEACHVFVGTTTNADDVFILTHAREADGLVTAWSVAEGGPVTVEASACVGFLRGRDIERYGPTAEDVVVVYPYGRGENAALLAWEAFQAVCPLAARYLGRHRRQLESREDGRWRDRPDWYCHAYPRNAWMIGQCKILVPDVALRPGFAIPERRDVLCLNTVYGVVCAGEGVDLRYILGVLNSAVFARHIAQHSVPLRGGYLRVSKNFAQEFPLRVLDLTHQTSASEKGQLLGHCLTAPGARDYETPLRLAEQALATHALLHGPAGREELREEPYWAEVIKTADPSFPGREDFVHDLLVMLAQRMMDLNRQKHETVQEFLQWVEVYCGCEVHALSNKTKLQGFWEHDGAALVDVLRANRKRLSKADPTGLGFPRVFLSRHEEAVRAVSPVLEALEKTDRLIDQVVYKLYGLAEEEIAVVEGTTGR